VNTPRPPSSTPTAVGLVGLPGLADPFRAAGLAVVGGKDFRGSATAIRDHIRDVGPLVVLAADTKVPGLVSWLDTTSANAPVVLLRTEPAGGMNPAGSSEVALPATIDTILAVGGMSGLGGVVGNAMVYPDGSVLPHPAATSPTPPPSVPSSPAEQEADPFADAAPAQGWDPEPTQQTRSAPAPGWDPEPAQPPPSAAPAQGWDPEPAQQTRSAPAPGWDPAPAQPQMPRGWDAPPETPNEHTPAGDHGWAAAPVRWDTAPAPATAPAALDPRADPYTSGAVEEEAQPQPRPPLAQGWGVEPQTNPQPRPPVQSAWDPQPTWEPGPAEDRGAPEAVPEPAPDDGRAFDWLAPAPATERPAPPGPWEASPAPAPVLPPAAQSAPAGDLYTSTDATDMFSADPRDAHGSAPRRSHTHLAPMIISLAAKGGVGKTSSATFLAQRAAEVGGLKVVLIDMNRGQGDIRKFLRLIGAPLPSMYDAAVRRDPRVAIITPDRLTAARHVRLDNLGFALAMAPPETMLDTDQVNAGVYRDVIDEARTVADLVIVDTQIVEAVDTSGLIDDVVIPALAKDAWALAISDVSMASVDNLKSRLTAFAEAGVPPDRVMFTVNRMSPGAVFNPEALADVFRHATTRVPLAHYVGAVAHDQAIADGMNIGGIEHNLPSIAPMLDTVLFRVTGLEAFDPARNAPRKKERRGLFSRLTARR